MLEKIIEALLDKINDVEVAKIELKQVSNLCYLIDKLEGKDVKPYKCFSGRIEGYKENRKYVAIFKGVIYNGNVKIEEYFERWM